MWDPRSEKKQNLTSGWKLRKCKLTMGFLGHYCISIGPFIITSVSHWCKMLILGESGYAVYRESCILSSSIFHRSRTVLKREREPIKKKKQTNGQVTKVNARATAERDTPHDKKQCALLEGCPARSPGSLSFQRCYLLARQAANPLSLCFFIFNNIVAIVSGGIQPLRGPLWWAHSYISESKGLLPQG